MTNKEKKAVKKLALSIYNISACLKIEVCKGNIGNVKLAIDEIQEELKNLKSYYNL